jgi:Glycosyltransferase
MEKRALANVDLAFYSSSWAAEAAVRAYGIPESKVRVIPFGANLDSEEAPADVARYIQAKSRSSCNLLFVGVDWKRKGLDVALETAAYLNQQGYPAKLHVVGAKDLDPSTLPDYVVFHGFLSKDQPEESARLKQLYETAHFLIVPSRAEAFGIVYSEASSYGVPSLSFASGGITTAIKNGENGQTFSLNADGTAFGEYVLKMMNDPAAYEALAANSFRRYQAELNWTVAGRFLIKSISQFI